MRHLTSWFGSYGRRWQLPAILALALSMNLALLAQTPTPAQAAGCPSWFVNVSTGDPFTPFQRTVAGCPSPDLRYGGAYEYVSANNDPAATNTDPTATLGPCCGPSGPGMAIAKGDLITITWAQTGNSFGDYGFDWCNHVWAIAWTLPWGQRVASFNSLAKPVPTFAECSEPPTYDSSAVVPGAPLGALIYGIGTSDVGGQLPIVQWYAIARDNLGVSSCSTCGSPFAAPATGQLYLAYNDIPDKYGDNATGYQVSVSARMRSSVVANSTTAVGGTVTLTANVAHGDAPHSGAVPVPNATVRFLIDSVLAGTATTDASGNAVLPNVSIGQRAPGNYKWTAMYAPDCSISLDCSETSSEGKYTVPSPTFTAVSAFSVYGTQSATVSATLNQYTGAPLAYVPVTLGVSPFGTVVTATDGNGVATAVIGTDARAPNVYQNDVSALYQDPAHDVSVSGAGNLTISEAVLTANPVTTPFGQPATFSATLVSATGLVVPSQPVTFDLNAANVFVTGQTDANGVAVAPNVSLRGLAVGTYHNALKVKWTVGGIDYATVFADVVIGTIPTALQLPNVSAQVTDTDVTFTANVTSPTGAVVNEGSVSFTVSNGGFTAGTVSGSVSGGAASAVFPLSNPGVYNLNPSTYSVSATYSDSAATNYQGSSAAASLIVTRGNAVPVINWPSPIPSIGHDQSFAPPVNVTASYQGRTIAGTYAYSVDGVALTGPVQLGGGLHTVSLIFTPLDSQNYVAVTGSNTITVTPSPLTIKALDATNVYGGANPTFAIPTALTQSPAYASFAGVLTFTTDATTTSPVGTYSVTPGGQYSPDFAIAWQPGTLRINPAAVAVTVADASGMAGGSSVTLNAKVVTVNTPYCSINPSGTTPVCSAVAGSLIAVNEGVVTFAINGGRSVTAPVSNGAASASLPLADIAAGSYPISATYADGASFPNFTTGYYDCRFECVAVSSGTASATLVVKQLLTWASPADIVYGTALGAAQLNATATDQGTAVPGAFSYTPAAGATLYVGAGQTLSAVFTPADQVKYQAATMSTTINVLPARLNVHSSDVTIVYGAPLPALGGTLSGVVNGDPITASYTTTATATSPIGTYPITAVLNDRNNRLSNYLLVNAPGTLTIVPAPLTVTVANGSKVYGATTPSAPFSATITGIQNGDPISASESSTDAATPATAVGAYPGSIVATVSDAGSGKLANYTVTNTPGDLAVTAAPLTVKASDATRAYGAANPAFAGTIIGIQGADPITASYSTAATQASGAGSYAIVPALSDGGSGKLANYSVTSANGTLTISPVPLTVTANPSTKIYGAANPAFSVSYSGFVNGDGAVSLAGTLTFATAATTSSPVGSYDVTPGGLTNGNYTISFVKGTLTVTSAKTATAASNATATFGDAGVTLSATVANSDTAAAVNEGTVTFTVTQGSATIGSASGNISGGAASATFSLGGVNAGSYTVTAAYADGASPANFQGSSATATLTINKAASKTVVTVPSNVTYDALPHSASATTTGVGGATVASPVVSYGPGSGVPTSAGSYTASASFAGNGNYLPSSDSKPYSIAKATPTLAWATPADIIVGTALGSAQLNATASFQGHALPGTFTYTPAAGTVLARGSGQVLSVRFAAADGTDFNVATAQVTINVDYTFSFLPPLGANQQPFGVGQTIPVKFALTNAQGQQVRTAVATLAVDGAPVAGQFVVNGNHYQLNLSTTGLAAGPHTLTVSLDDGSTHSDVVTLVAA